MLKQLIFNAYPYIVLTPFINVKTLLKFTCKGKKSKVLEVKGEKYG